jgi:hypothetical protein
MGSLERCCILPVWVSSNSILMAWVALKFVVGMTSDVAVLKEEQVCRSWWVYIPMRGVECGSGASLEGRGFGISVLYVKLWRIRGEDGKGI